MRSLVTTNELIGECETRHEPEFGSGGSGEKDALNCGESNQALSKSRPLLGNPSQTRIPVNLTLDARDASARGGLKDL